MKNLSLTIISFLFATAFGFAQNISASETAPAYYMLVSNPTEDIFGEEEMDLANEIAQMVTNGEVVAFGSENMEEVVDGGLIAKSIEKATSIKGFEVKDKEVWGSAHDSYTEVMISSAKLADRPVFQLKVVQEIAYDHLHTPIAIKNKAVVLYMPEYATVNGKELALAFIPVEALTNQLGAYWAINSIELPQLIKANKMTELMAVKEVQENQPNQNFYSSK